MKPTVTVMRHGEAKYAQGKVLLGGARDLTSFGEQQVVSAARKLAATIGPDEQVRMWSSPFARTLQTATIVYDVLAAQNHSFALKNVDVGMCAQNVIRSLHRFDEVRNLDLQLFLSFLNGGDAACPDGGVVVLEKTITNPDGLSFAEYFNTRAWGSVTAAPQQLLDAMHSIEQPADTQSRLDGVLRKLGRVLSPQKTRIILVTHQGVMEGLSKETINPADFVTINL
jgi:broad specificity phosphatase PhoE